MSDWQVGDMALCVDARANPTIGRVPPLVEGRTYRVAGFAARTGGLLVDGAKAANEAVGAGWRHSRFRKIRPDEHQACEPEFVTLLRKSKQRVGA